MVAWSSLGGVSVQPTGLKGFAEALGFPYKPYPKALQKALLAAMEKLVFAAVLSDDHGDSKMLEVFHNWMFELASKAGRPDRSARLSQSLER